MKTSSRIWRKANMALRGATAAANDDGLSAIPMKTVRMQSSCRNLTYGSRLSTRCSIPKARVRSGLEINRTAQCRTLLAWAKRPTKFRKRTLRHYRHTSTTKTTRPHFPPQNSTSPTRSASTYTVRSKMMEALHEHPIDFARRTEVDEAFDCGTQKSLTSGGYYDILRPDSTYDGKQRFVYSNAEAGPRFREHTSEVVEYEPEYTTVGQDPHSVEWRALELYYAPQSVRACRRSSRTAVAARAAQQADGGPGRGGAAPS
ncbi:hypothetical protein BKA62DRAFT_509691 [Auriculariales sp. MPI-PUGE-AT-0066]|nr:hypothetical protein BKA62DRAFT_509691 [Auriculariales sp. MPI-PUGE-AT-0066]